MSSRPSGLARPAPAFAPALAGACLAALCLPALCLPATAQDAAPTFGNWGLKCEAVQGGGQVCVLSQTILRASDKAFAAEFLLFAAADGAPLLAVRVPIGAHLPSGFVIRAEGDEADRVMIWQSCNPQLCEAALPVDADLLARMDGGGPVKAVFRPNGRSEPFLFAFSGGGAAAGLQALKEKGAAAAP